MSATYGIPADIPLTRTEPSMRPITPSALPAGTTNNYNPTDATSGLGFHDAQLIRQATNADGSTLTGLDASLIADGQYVVIENIGPGVLTLAHNSVSTDANRFSLPDSSDMLLASGASVMLARDNDSSRWRAVGSPGNGARIFSVRDFGAKGDGSTDDAAAIQRAIASTAGRILFFPKGQYRINSTITIDDRCHRLVGEFGTRNNVSGTEIQFFGTGPCFQIGTDDGVDWDAGHYGGADSEQDQIFENLWISHGAPDTALDGSGDATLRYKAGAYGIWDWYGGQVVLRNVGIENFEANFVGIQSDINTFEYVISLYSKYGIYAGPRSDQWVIRDMMSFFCDRALTVDRASQLRLVDAQIVGCGHATAAAIEIRRGTTQTCIVRPWFEHLQGYQGVDQVAFVSVGEVDGYGAGGSISSPGGSPNTASCDGVVIENPFVYTTAAATACHTKYLAAVGKAKRLALNHPIPQIGASLSNLDSLVGVQADQAPTNADTQIAITGVSSDSTVSKLYTNLGAGSPAWHIEATGASGRKFWGLGEHALEGDDGGSHVNRPAVTVRNTGTGAFGHRSALLLVGRDSGGTERTATVQGEAGALTMTSGNNQNVSLNAGTGDIVALSTMRIGATTGPTLRAGAGSPEGAVTAGGGSLYIDTTNFKLYVKESASGNTGWVIK